MHLALRSYHHQLKIPTDQIQPDCLGRGREGGGGGGGDANEVRETWGDMPQKVQNKAWKGWKVRANYDWMDAEGVLRTTGTPWSGVLRSRLPDDTTVGANGVGAGIWGSRGKCPLYPRFTAK